MFSDKNNLKNVTVLYVEDENSIRSTVEHCLKYIFNIVVAKNGEEGFDIFNKENIDLVITDINMPVKDGISMLNDIKSISPNTPFIIASAYNKEEKDRIDDLGVFECIAKPFDMKELVQSTIKALD